jgi:hypothetical protein
MDNPSGKDLPEILFIPSLVSMRQRGFDLDGLLHMQTAAVRLAAQLIQHQLVSKDSVTVGELRLIIEKILSGSSPASADLQDVTPGHIAGYMQSKIMLQTSTPKHLLEEAWTLKNTPLNPESFTPEQQEILTRWLAHDLLELRFSAATLETLTPGLAKIIRDNTSKIESTFVHAKALRAILQARFTPAGSLDQEPDPIGDQ